MYSPNTFSLTGMHISKELFKTLLSLKLLAFVYSSASSDGLQMSLLVSLKHVPSVSTADSVSSKLASL